MVFQYTSLNLQVLFLPDICLILIILASASPENNIHNASNDGK